MKEFCKKIVSLRIPILIIAVLLLIPSAFGYFNTKVNYDILYYLPDSIETMQGQQILLDDFGKGAYAMFVADGMTDEEAARLKDRLDEVEHVEQIIWYTSLADISIPEELLPDEIYDAFHSDTGTVMAIFFDGGTSEDSTLNAINEIREIAGEECYLSSMSAIVADTRQLVEDELFWYVLIAVVLSCIVLALTMDSWMAPVLFMANIGMAIVYNMGSNVLTGEISFITQSLAAILQLAVTMDYSIFLWDSYKEEKALVSSKEEAMANAISLTLSSVVGSSLTTIAGFIALCFMEFTLGMDLGVVMAKGVVFGVIGCVTILPSLILTFDKAIEKTRHKPLTIRTDRFPKFVLRHYKVLLAILLLWIPAIIGYRQMNVYYKLDASLPSYLNSVQANQVLEEDFDMATVHMVLCDDDMSSKDMKAMLAEMEDVDGVKLAFAEDSLIGSAIPKEFIPEEVTETLSAGGHQLVMILSEYGVATDEVGAQIDDLEAIMKRYDPEGMLIGEAPCTEDLIEITDHDFSVVNLVSIAMIFILILVVLGSVSLPVLLVLVIELAIYINLGLSFYTGATLPFIASIVIGTVQLGSTVDYAILMTNRYQRERIAGLDKMAAAEKALAASTPSILTSALGFFAATIGVGIYSDVDLIGSLCILMARGALISMGIVLILLPCLYVVFDGLIMKSSWKIRRAIRKQG